MKQTFAVGLIFRLATAAHAKTVSVTMNKIHDKGVGPDDSACFNSKTPRTA